MKPQELFGLAVRLVGLFFVVQGVSQILQILGMVVAGPSAWNWHMLNLGVSAVFILCADRLVSLAYRKTPGEPPKP